MKDALIENLLEHIGDGGLVELANRQSGEPANPSPDHKPLVAPEGLGERKPPVETQSGDTAIRQIVETPRIKSGFTTLKDALTAFNTLLEVEPFLDQDRVYESEWYDMVIGPSANREDLRGISLFPGDRFLSCRIYMGGKLRSIAGSSISKGWRVARYYDMALLHFWKYRQRNVRPLTDHDFNFGMSRAEKDTVEYPEYVDLLKRVEAFALEMGWLKPLKEQGAVVRKRYNTAAGKLDELERVLRGFGEEFSFELDKIKALVERQTAMLKQQNEFIARILPPNTSSPLPKEVNPVPVDAASPETPRDGTAPLTC